MRQLEEMGFYAVKNDGGSVSGCHAVRARAPEFSVEISEADYRALCSAKRSERAVEAIEAENQPQVVIALAEADKRDVQNIVAAIVEQNTVDNSEDINALRLDVGELASTVADKFAEYDAVFEAIREKAKEG